MARGIGLYVRSYLYWANAAVGITEEREKERKREVRSRPPTATIHLALSLSLSLFRDHLRMLFCSCIRASLVHSRFIPYVIGRKRATAQHQAKVFLVKVEFVSFPLLWALLGSLLIRTINKQRRYILYVTLFGVFTEKNIS